MKQKQEKKPRTLKQALTAMLTDKELELVRGSFDIIGDIAIIEIDKRLEKKEKLIAETLLSMHKNIKVVCKKLKAHSGEFRLQKTRILAGCRRKETIYKENGVRLMLNIDSTYFSPRLSTERKRIAEQVKKGERVLVMFSGVCPYSIVIAKHSEAAEIIAVEKNPKAAEYAEKNIRLNKLKNIKAYCADVSVAVPKLGKFDRIIMPLPKGAHNFLSLAFSASKDNAIIHYYDFLEEDKIISIKDIIREAAGSSGFSVSFLSLRKCGQQSPRVYRVVADFRVSKK